MHLGVYTLGVDLLGVVILGGVILGRTPEMFIVASNIGQQQHSLPKWLAKYY